MLDVKREPITLREWLGHMLLFHANIQIRDDSMCTIYTVMLMESRAYSSSSNEETITSVPPHTIKPDYSHLNSIPLAEPSARFTITLGEKNDSEAARLIHFKTFASSATSACASPSERRSPLHVLRFYSTSSSSVEMSFSSSRSTINSPFLPPS